jgi:hypothetical protein
MIGLGLKAEVTDVSKSRRDDTLLTVCFSLRAQDTDEATARDDADVSKSRRDDTLLTVCFSLREETRRVPAAYCLYATDAAASPVLSARKLKHTVNKVSSLRDLSDAADTCCCNTTDTRCRNTTDTRCVSARKLKHTVNKVSSLRDLSDAADTCCRNTTDTRCRNTTDTRCRNTTDTRCVSARKLKHTVNKVSSLRDLSDAADTRSCG